MAVRIAQTAAVLLSMGMGMAVTPSLSQQSLPRPMEQRAIGPTQNVLPGGAVDSHICAENREVALERALLRHQALIQMLVRTKGLPENRRLETDPSRFQQVVYHSLSARRENGLLLYAVDAEYLCAFLWTGDGNAVYARSRNGAEYLTVPAKQLAMAVVDSAATRSATVRKRVERLRNVSDVFAAPVATGAVSVSDAAGSMSRLLFPEPLWTALAGIKHLSIIPIGAISSMPLAILHPLGTSERVIDRFSINILLFASEVGRPVEIWQPNLKNALVMGNPTGSDVFWRETPIPAAEAEARYVAEKFAVIPLLGPEATTIAFIRRAATAELIYLAAHGVAGSGETDDPLRDSYLVMADNRMPGSTIRDFARSSERLAAKLVVLSACQTGIGRVTEGGVVGLARTFLDAGAANVVMTTWNVDDEATRELMSRFINNLDRNQPADALRLAQQHVMQMFPDPVYWSAFNVYGNRFAEP